MKLSEWCEKTGIHHTHPTTEKGAVSVISDGGALPSTHGMLWKLDDYVVSSVSGPVVWLVPRKVKDTWRYSFTLTATTEMAENIRQAVEDCVSNRLGQTGDITVEMH